MSRKFNVNGVCYPDEHYMVNIDSKLAEIKELVDEKQYFVINRARQYGKTTTLNLLVKYLKKKSTKLKNAPAPVQAAAQDYLLQIPWHA